MSNAVHGVSSRHQSLSCRSPASWHWNKKRWWGSRKPSDRQACWQARNHTWHLTALVKSLVNMHKQSMEKQLSRSRPVGWQCLSCLPWQCSFCCVNASLRHGLFPFQRSVSLRFEISHALCREGLSWSMLTVNSAPTMPTSPAWWQNKKLWVANAVKNSAQTGSQNMKLQPEWNSQRIYEKHSCTHQQRRLVSQIAVWDHSDQSILKMRDVVCWNMLYWAKAHSSVITLAPQGLKKNCSQNWLESIGRTDISSHPSRSCTPSSALWL